MYEVRMIRIIVSAGHQSFICITGDTMEYKYTMDQDGSLCIEALDAEAADFSNIEVHVVYKYVIDEVGLCLVALDPR